MKYNYTKMNLYLGSSTRIDAIT